MGEWVKWLLMAGRGFGKTRVGSEATVGRVAAHVEGGADFVLRIALVGQTPADVRKVMVEGESGILAVCPPWLTPEWNRTAGELRWHDHAGNLVALAESYSGWNPGKLRGPQHHFAWADELAAWKYPDAWDQLMFSLRLGSNPQVIITTTPKPVRTVRELMKDEHCRITTGTTYDNAANLPRSYLDDILGKYEGTTLGQQEIYAQLLDETPGALWTRDLITENRVTETPDLERIVVAIDPAVSSNPDSDETGIAVCGRDANGHGYVLADASGIWTPDQWAKRALWQYFSLDADRIIGEKNQGGELVRTNILHQDQNASVKLVHASRGKYARAEPIVALYEQHRIHHVGTYADLEDQMCNWTVESDWSPDRMDALVWGMTELFPGKKPGRSGWLDA